MASIKKTRSKTSTSTGVKRKGLAETVDQKSKKTRMGEEPTSEELRALGEEITLLLEPVIAQVDTIIKAFPQYRDQQWFKALQTRQLLIPTLSTKVKSRDGLSTRPELKPIEREGSPFKLPGADMQAPDCDLVDENLKDLDDCFKKVIDQSQELQELPAPSIYCLSTQYRRFQSNPRTAVHDGRAGTPPIALELLHFSFRTFTYWSFHNPYPLPGSPAHSQDTRPIDEDAFIKVYQAANQLLLSMPQLYKSHDDRLDDFRTALLLIFPNNEVYEWVSSMATGSSGPAARYKVDLVYRHRRNRIPLFFVEVKLELGEGGNPFWQNHRLYQSYTKENIQSRRNGAPVFFIQLCGMTSLRYGSTISYILPSGTLLGVAGGFYDVTDDSISPAVLQLGGYVNLQRDYVGRNLREAVNTLWALHEAISQIPTYAFLMHV
jgi:hypothetical protein